MECNKTLDLPSSKKIFNKTLGLSKPFSSSCLGPSSCRKPKAKAAKHQKSSFKPSFKPPDSSYSSTSSKHRSGSLISTRLFNEEPFHVFHDQKFCVLIAILLFYIYSLKILHRPLDKGKYNLHVFIFKTSTFTKHSNMFQTSSSQIFHCVSIFELSNFLLFVIHYIN